MENKKYSFCDSSIIQRQRLDWNGVQRGASPLTNPLRSPLCGLKCYLSHDYLAVALISIKNFDSGDKNMIQKRNSLISFILLSVIIILNCSKNSPNETNLTKEKYIGITTNNNSAVRINPFIFSAKINQLKKGASVQIKKKTQEKQKIGKYYDYWYKIKLKKGITGWIFGSNLKILTEKDSIDNYISDFVEEELNFLRKNISGKWWSVNKYNNFTNHGIEFYGDGKYKSYLRGSKDKAIESDFTVDFNKNEIIFLKGTSFGKNLKFTVRGNTYILKNTLKKSDMRFKKILKDDKYKNNSDN